MKGIKPRGVVATNAYLRREVKSGESFEIGMCKAKCRGAYLIPSNGDPDAKAAALHARHTFTNAWVWGAFMFFKIGAHWHVAICGLVKGVIFTTDNPRSGHWNRTTLEAFYELWPTAEFYTFSLDIDGVQVRKMPRVSRRWKP